MIKLTKAERVAKKKKLKAEKAEKELAKRKVVKVKLSKKQAAKRAEFFSVKAYLYKKAQVRALKLQYRAAKRSGTLPVEEAPAEEHVHGEGCNHDHEHIHAEEAKELPF